MTLRIWFNRTFATAIHYVEMIRNNPDGLKVKIYATHPKRHSLMLQAADYSELEPTLPMDEYVQYCLDFCRKHQIDVFFPHYGLTDIAPYIEDFNQIRTKVMLSGDPELLKIVSDKGELFNKLADIEGLHIPEHYVVTTLDEFERAYTNLLTKGLDVCVKPVTGEGGAGFRIIDNAPPTIQSLYESVKPRIYIGDILRLLEEHKGPVAPLMIMEHLKGSEYSVDCLGTKQQLLAAVPRKKVEGRIRALEDNNDLIRLSTAIHRRLPLQYNFNIQFIYQGDTPKLLEINPRMSGGMYTSCLSGVNFPYLALKLLLGRDVPIQEYQLNIMATHYEKEIILKHHL
ncbi:carbamoyl phosphate synthase-like protein [compost metagenome]